MIRVVKRERRALVLFFHNFARFDGILLMRHLMMNHKDLRCEPLMRNRIMYELRIYTFPKPKNPEDKPKKRLLFRFRDSNLLIQGPLKKLAESLCPELGGKGGIDHNKVSIENMSANKESYQKYLRQDILILGGVMLKAQSIFWNEFLVDIVEMRTIAAMSLDIFRMNFYDDVKHRIYNLNKNADSFIRRGYYGGHADAYIPYSENIYYYDVNSLYPSVMKGNKMPGGQPVWHGNLRDKNLDDMFGFIEALIHAPKDMKRPFLPKKDKNILHFKTGWFVGVYFSEELKYAKTLGYKVVPLEGFLFEKMDSPFGDYISTISERRIEAKKKGNQVEQLGFKLLMNSNYGRLAIAPDSTACRVLSDDEIDHFMKSNDNIIDIFPIDDGQYLAVYKTNIFDESESEGFRPPPNTAPHISAAITAYARIHMYPFISMEECLYTDTDSVVLTKPLPEEVLSPTELGKFKREHEEYDKGIFLAPKSYILFSSEHVRTHLKQKGAARGAVDLEWFKDQLNNPELSKVVTVDNPFHVTWKKLQIVLKKQSATAQSKSEKRIKVYKRKKWVDTKPFYLDEKDLLLSVNSNKTMQNIVMLLLEENTSLKKKLNQSRFVEDDLKPTDNIKSKKIRKRIKSEEVKQIDNQSINNSQETNPESMLKNTEPSINSLPHTEPKPHSDTGSHTDRDSSSESDSPDDRDSYSERDSSPSDTRPSNIIIVNDDDTEPPYWF
uniref:DNA-directed DNA polymerase n=1 Tax=Stipa capillata TaxID=665498 RepID=A0A8F6U9Q0_9POAL|nr:hypothetical protein [Stipa capillata]